MNDLCIHELGSWMKLHNLMKDDYDLSWCNGWLRSSVKVLFTLFDIPKLSIQHLSTAVLVSMITDSFFAVAWCFFNVPRKVCLHVMLCVLGRTPVHFSWFGIFSKKSFIFLCLVCNVEGNIILNVWTGGWCFVYIICTYVALNRLWLIAPFIVMMI